MPLPKNLAGKSFRCTRMTDRAVFNRYWFKSDYLPAFFMGFINSLSTICCGIIDRAKNCAKKLRFFSSLTKLTHLNKTL